MSASDIHFVPCGARKTDILFRIDGQLTRWYSIDDVRSDAVITALKTRCINMDRYERMSVQEGLIQKMPENARFTVSVLPVASSDPAVRFETIVLRAAQSNAALRTLDQLGLSTASQAAIRDALSVKAGLIIVTGPARSGKTTTLHAMLKAVIRPTLNAVAVEDPLELLIDGVRQVRLNAKLTFDDALEGVMKHDPDVVLLGDLRTRDAMAFALRLATSGSLVLASLRAHDTVGALQRIYQSGIEPYLLGRMVRLVHAQRLVRCLCERCREKESGGNKSNRAKLGIEESAEIALYKPVGCIDCIGGFHGRTAIAETLVCTPEIADIVASSVSGLQVQALRERAALQGMEPLVSSARALLAKGGTTVEELLNVLS